MHTQAIALKHVCACTLCMYINISLKRCWSYQYCSRSKIFLKCRTYIRATGNRSLISNSVCQDQVLLHAFKFWILTGPFFVGPLYFQFCQLQCKCVSSNNSVWPLYHGSTWLFFTLYLTLQSTYRASTWLYISWLINHSITALLSSTGLYLTLLHSTRPLLGCTWFYYTCTIAPLGSTWLHLTLLHSTIT